MRTALIAGGVLGLGFMLTTLTGCQTDSPGMRNYLGTFVAKVDAAPDQVTDAAVKTLTEMKLDRVTGNGTKIDGHVTARNADDDEVEIEITLVGENVSKVAIHVGDTGDKVVSRQILDGIKSKVR